MRMHPGSAYGGKAWYENRDGAKLSHNLGYEFAEEAKKNADKCETCATIVNLRHYLAKTQPVDCRR